MCHITCFSELADMQESFFFGWFCVAFKIYLKPYMIKLFVLFLLIGTLK